MQEIYYQILEFDTAIFGFKVAKIVAPRLSLLQLQETLDELRAQNIRLVYWPSDSDDYVSQQAARELNGFLGSRQTTFVLDLKKLAATNSPLTAPEVSVYPHKITDPQLEQLAFYAGTNSHFHTDPNFPPELFLKLYRAWIENSVNGVVAKKVLITHIENKITGMITLGIKNMRGDIGLLGIDPKFRGQSLGTKLVRAAQAYFIAEGFSHAQVVTQKENTIACHLYEKCGFIQEKIENFYHFWL